MINDYAQKWRVKGEECVVDGLFLVVDNSSQWLLMTVDTDRLKFSIFTTKSEVFTTGG